MTNNKDIAPGNSVDQSINIDPELLQFFTEIATLEKALSVPKMPQHYQARHSLELAIQYGRSSPLIPAQISTQDGFITLDGRELAYRLYRPRYASGQIPVLLYAHGGGWVAGDIYTHDALCAEMALRTGYGVISLQYRRAPENPYPAGHVDMWETWEWLRCYGELLGLDPTTIALGGDSAGAHLALGCALRNCREGNLKTQAEKLLLWYPNTDRNADTTSRKMFGEGFGLSIEDMEYFWSCTEGSRTQDQNDPILYPGHTSVPTNLPPSVIVTAEYDLLRDEAESYAKRMQTANNNVTLIRAKAMLHGFARLHLESQAANLWVRRGCEAFLQLSSN